MLVAFAYRQPHAQCHQRTREPEGKPGRLSQQQQRQSGANEGRGGEVRAGTGGTQVAQREHERDQADHVANQAYHRGPSKRWRGWL